MRPKLDAIVTKIVRETETDPDGAEPDRIRAVAHVKFALADEDGWIMAMFVSPGTWKAVSIFDLGGDDAYETERSLLLDMLNTLRRYEVFDLSDESDDATDESDVAA
jgi:hypothetical protein